VHRVHINQNISFYGQANPKSPGTAKAEAPSLTPSQEFEAQLDQIPPLLCSAFYFLCPIDPLDDWSELLSTVLLLE
jgi:hypothetical protein